jgi:transcriptional regulator GlxA family with amidase domain
MKAEIDLLRELPKRAKIIASSCSGAALLATAGLLDGYRATTCWWLADWFQHRFPAVQLHAEQVLIAEKQRWTSAAGGAYMHLGIELVRELAGDKVANVTSRLMLVEPRRGTQSPFLIDASPTGHHDPDVKRVSPRLPANPAHRACQTVVGELVVGARPNRRALRLR